MKFSSLEHEKVKTFNVKDFNGGVNLFDPTDNVSDSQLTDCLNLWHTQGRLKTRPGLDSDIANIVRQKLPYENDICNYRITETGFNLNGEYCRIAVADVEVALSHHFSYIYFITPDKSVTEAGYLYFARVTSETFYQPQNILFFTGASVNGGGIYALVTLQNGSDTSDRWYEIFEINEQHNEWNVVNNFYIPTVYINGRGTRFEEAKATNQAYTASPVTLEAPNMLGGRFYAYFTSDGFSSCFRLPLSGLSSTHIICRVYQNIESYTEWTVFAGKNSATAKFFTADVTLTVDRQKGIINFTDAEGDFPLPMMRYYHENNIRILAGKETQNGIESIVSSSCATVLDSKIILSGGCEGNRVFCASVSNPLYFPASVQIGGADQAVTALALQGDYLIAFKKSEMYALKLKKGGALNTTSLLADNDAIFHKPDSFDVTLITNQNGCINKNTIARCGNQTVWLGNDGKIYTLSSVTGREIFEISKPVSPLLRQFSKNQQLNAFAMSEYGYYLLKIGEKAIIMEHTPSELKSPDFVTEKGFKGVRWFIWNFPQGINIRGGFTYGGRKIFMCTGSDERICYIASLDGKEDTDVFFENGQPVLKHANIKGSITTKKFDFGSFTQKKFIDSIFLPLAGTGKIEIRINGEVIDIIDMYLSDQDYFAGVMHKVKLAVALIGAESVYITLSSEDNFSIGGMSVYYRLTE